MTIKKIKNIQNRKKIPILVGGTGLYFQSLIKGLVEIPEIPLKFRNKIRLMQKKDGQKKFYKKLIKLDPNIKDKFDLNDVQRSIRAFEIKSFTKISMYDWLKKTESKFKDNDFLKLYIDFKREDLVKRIALRTIKMVQGGALKEVEKFLKVKIKKDHSVNKVIGIDELTQYLKKKINLDEAKEFIKLNRSKSKKLDILRGKTQINLFFEPSTRTQSSFDFARHGAAHAQAAQPFRRHGGHAPLFQAPRGAAATQAAARLRAGGKARAAGHPLRRPSVHVTTYIRICLRNWA